MSAYQDAVLLAVASMFIAIGALGYVIWRLAQMIEDLDVYIADRKRDRKGPR